MDQPPWDFAQRTLQYTVAVIRFCRTLPKTGEAAEIARQLRRSAASLGAHYRAAKRNKSDKDYINKVNGGIEEGDETLYWLEILNAAGIAPSASVKPLLAEGDEIVSILVKCKSTAVTRLQRLRVEKTKRTART